MTTLPLATDLADRAVEASERGEFLDPQKEAQRLLRRHPEAEHNLDEVTETLSEEASAAGARVRRIDRR